MFVVDELGAREEAAVRVAGLFLRLGEVAVTEHGAERGGGVLHRLTEAVGAAGGLARFLREEVVARESGEVSAPVLRADESPSVGVADLQDEELLGVGDVEPLLQAIRDLLVLCLTNTGLDVRSKLIPLHRRQEPTLCLAREAEQTKAHLHRTELPAERLVDRVLDRLADQSAERGGDRELVRVPAVAAPIGVGGSGNPPHALQDRSERAPARRRRRCTAALQEPLGRRAEFTSELREQPIVGRPLAVRPLRDRRLAHAEPLRELRLIHIRPGHCSSESLFEAHSCLQSLAGL